MIHQVHAQVRKCGSIGCFDWTTFYVEAPEHSDRAALLTAWQKQYSHGTTANYELFQFRATGLTTQENNVATLIYEIPGVGFAYQPQGQGTIRLLRNINNIPKPHAINPCPAILDGYIRRSVASGTANFAD